MKNSKEVSEAKRLEKLWAGSFGDDYIVRNKDAGSGRGIFWKSFLSEFPVKNVLEIGCNIGANLKWIAKALPPDAIYGIDISETALKKLRAALPGIHASLSAARSLPFENGKFDLVFSAGVLIHQPEETLPEVISQMVRCSGRYVLCLEYFFKETVEVPYRGHEGALFKRDYGGLFKKLFPELTHLRSGFLNKSDGWDDVTFWLFEKGNCRA